MSPTIFWFRRDLRLADNPALLAAASAGEVIPVFVLDDVLRRPAGAPRLAFLYRTLRYLEEETGGRLRILRGSPAEVLPAAVTAGGASAVHASTDCGPYGRRRDAGVADALETVGSRLVRTGSPYAVTPGRITRPASGGYAVFSPFYRAWQRHGWRSAAGCGEPIRWSSGGLDSVGVPADPRLDGTSLPAAGEAAAVAAWEAFRDERLSSYAQRRNLTADGATSRLSVYLKYGCLHPRTLLAELGDGAGAESFRSELAWREFYADVLWHRPDAAWSSMRPDMDALTKPRSEHDDAGPEAEDCYAAWCAGRTGYPIVDAAMRHLAAEAWMPNRVRMVVASFLVKDLHQPWQRGARFFLDHLVDGDLASNNLSWQWVAGTGTDPAPYYRIFNPVRQGLQFDPDGDYVRRWVPELRAVAGPAVHEPWRSVGGLPGGYPERIVDHAAERAEALRRFTGLRSG